MAYILHTTYHARYLFSQSFFHLLFLYSYSTHRLRLKSHNVLLLVFQSISSLVFPPNTSLLLPFFSLFTTPFLAVSSSVYLLPLLSLPSFAVPLFSLGAPPWVCPKAMSQILTSPTPYSLLRFSLFRVLRLSFLLTPHHFAF